MADFRIRFEHDGPADLARRYRRFPQVWGRHAATGINRTAEAGQRASRAHVSVDTRRLWGSIDTTPARDIGGLVQGGWGTDVEYGVHVEYGRRPGATPPPASALHGWLARHGIPISAAFVVARNIGRRGIRPKYFIRRAVAEIRPVVRREMRAALQRTLRDIGGQ